MQVQEMIEVNKRKDELISSQKDQIDRLYAKVKDHLLVQDQLYKDYVTVERNSEHKQVQLKENCRKFEDLLLHEQIKCKKYEETLRAIQGSAGSESVQARIVELTKQNAMNEVNLMKMSRKYQALEE